MMASATGASGQVDFDPKVKAFLVSCEDSEMIRMLLAVPGGKYPRKHVDSLRKLLRHMTARSPPMGNIGKSPRHPLRAIMNMSSLQPCLDPHDYLEQELFDPADFLCSNAIQHRMGSTGNTGNDFLVRYQFTLELVNKCPTDHKARWCYTMLGYFDLIQLICPGKSAKKVGDAMLQDVRDFLEGIVPAAESEAVLDNINEWSNYGSKLDEFCTAFKGEGCLLYIADKMSQDFLGEKYRRTGKYHDEGFAHLASLGLEEEAEASGANEFGSLIRRHFIAPFQEASELATEGQQ